MISEDILIGKTISEIEVDGYGLKIVTTDGFVLRYEASDGGYSSWDVDTLSGLEAKKHSMLEGCNNNTLLMAETRRYREIIKNMFQGKCLMSNNADFIRSLSDDNLAHFLSNICVDTIYDYGVIASWQKREEFDYIYGNMTTFLKMDFNETLKGVNENE